MGYLRKKKSRRRTQKSKRYPLNSENTLDEDRYERSDRYEERPERQEQITSQRSMYSSNQHQAQWVLRLLQLPLEKNFPAQTDSSFLNRVERLRREIKELIVKNEYINNQ